MSFLPLSRRSLALGASGFAAALLAAGLLLPRGVDAQEGEADAPAPAHWAVDPVHSSIVFRIKHLDTAWVFGRFNEFDGSISFDDANLADSSINLVVQAASVDTNNEQRDNHLRSPDFFTVTEMPTITFESTSIEPAGSDSYTVIGDLALLGETRPVEASMSITGSGANRAGTPLIGAMAEFTIKRSDFGMDFMMGGLSDDVHLTVSIEAQKQDD